MPESFENRETEQTSEKMVSDAISAEENKAAADPVEGSWWSKKAKEFFNPSENLEDAKGVAKGAFKTTAFLGVVGGILSYKVLKGVLTFITEVVKKEGQVGFKGGFEIGKEILNFGNKKEKK